MTQASRSPATPVSNLLHVSLETTGPIVQMCLRNADVPEARWLAVEFAKQGLRAARLLGLYLDDA